MRKTKKKRDRWQKWRLLRSRPARSHAYRTAVTMVMCPRVVVLTMLLLLLPSPAASLTKLLFSDLRRIELLLRLNRPKPKLPRFWISILVFCFSYVLSFSIHCHLYSHIYITNFLFELSTFSRDLKDKQTFN